MFETRETYRIYTFDESRMIVSAEAIQASSSEEAIAAVESMGYASKCEIWRGRELIAKFHAERAA